ncbi:MAG: metallophosphoesterase family protein [Desulfobacterales bacterium]|nr:metallophosphoesterase family protein [Desulfobacterales bacterium]
MEKNKTVIGIVSDTHGLLRNSVVDELNGSALIVHAGDFDTPEVLAEIKKIAPVLAARGNMDRGTWAEGFAAFDLTEIAENRLCVIHDLHHLDLDPTAAGIAAVISGHTHQPAISEHKGVLYINPGSAGPRRSGKPLSVAKLVIQNGRLVPEIVILDD